MTIANFQLSIILGFLWQWHHSHYTYTFQF